MNIVLIGYRATGKSTVGQLLAEKLGWTCIDTDVEIERRAGKPIRDIFEQDGEPVFRDLESATITELAGQPSLVVSVGGGAVLRSQNRRVLQELGTIVWLRATVDTISKRLAGDATTRSRRPNLTTSGGRAEIVELLREREPLYRQCANLTLDTEQHSPHELAAEIARRIDVPPSGEESA